MTPLMVCCVLVQGEYPYTPEYVRRLHVMCRRYITRPFRFVCFTDDPGAIDTSAGIELGYTAKIQDCFAFWTKLRLFDYFRRTSARILYLDLDVLLVNDLAPIIDFPATLALTEDAFITERAHINTDRYGRRLVRRFNSSVMVWDGGTYAHLWDEWTVNAAQQLSTDQDWIAEQAWDAQPLPLSWFPRASRVQPPWDADAKVVLCKKPKNHEAIQKWPWFEQAWGGWAA